MQRTKNQDLKRNGLKPPLPPRPRALASVLERNAKRTAESPSGRRIRPRSTAESTYERDSTSVIKTAVSTPQHYLKSDSLNGSCTNFANVYVTARQLNSSTLPRRKIKEDVNTRQMELQARSTLSLRRPRTICTVGDPTVESKRATTINLRTHRKDQSTSSNQLQQMSPSNGSRSRLCNGAKEPPKSANLRPPRPPPIRPPKTILRPNISPEAGAKTKPSRPPPPVHRRFRRPPMPLPYEANQNGPELQPGDELYSYIHASVKRMLYPSESGTSARAEFLDGNRGHEAQETSVFNIYSELDDAAKEKDRVYAQLQGRDATDTFSPDHDQTRSLCTRNYESLTKSTMEQASNYTVPSLFRPTTHHTSTEARLTTSYIEGQ